MRNEREIWDKRSDNRRSNMWKDKIRGEISEEKSGEDKRAEKNKRDVEKREERRK